MGSTIHVGSSVNDDFSPAAKVSSPINLEYEAHVNSFVLSASKSIGIFILVAWIGSAYLFLDKGFNCLISFGDHI
jgi:hypothetical protein